MIYFLLLLDFSVITSIVQYILFAIFYFVLFTDDDQSLLGVRERSEERLMAPGWKLSCPLQTVWRWVVALLLIAQNSPPSEIEGEQSSEGRGNERFDLNCLEGKI